MENKVCEIAKTAGRNYITPEDITQALESGIPTDKVQKDVLEVLGRQAGFGAEDQSLCAFVAFQGYQAVVETEDKPKLFLRHGIQYAVFQQATEKIKEIIIENYRDPHKMHWGHIGDMHSINSNLVDIIEAYDEDLANELREKINS